MTFKIKNTRITIVNLLSKNHINDYWKGRFEFHSKDRNSTGHGYSYVFGIVFISIWFYSNPSNK